MAGGWVLYADGILEAVNAQREEFGRDRRHAATRESVGTSPQRMADRIIGLVRACSRAQDDDLTVLVCDSVGAGWKLRDRIPPSDPGFQLFGRRGGCCCGGRCCRRRCRCRSRSCGRRGAAFARGTGGGFGGGVSVRIPATALESDSRRRDDALQRAAAVRADRDLRVRELLDLFDEFLAGDTFVFVKRHDEFL